MKVPLLDLTQQYERFAAEAQAAIARVCQSQHFILGAEGRELERSLASYTGCQHGIGVSSGTDALLLALMALGIGPGDEVITSPFTFFATAGTIARVGARPVFCDIDRETFNLSPALVAEFLAQSCEVRGSAGGRELVNRKTGGRIKAIMPVHLYGQACDMDAFMEIAERYGLHVIEDAAQAIGAQDARGRMVGSVGDIGCFSFFPTKNLGAFGDAGMCTTNDAALAERMRVLRVHGMEPKYHHSLIGGNFRLDEIQAAVLNVKLEFLDKWRDAREAHARQYTERLQAKAAGGAVVTPAPSRAGRHVWNQYVIRAQRRDELRPYLASAGIGTEIYYPIPLHLQQCFAYLGHRPGEMPESERAAAEVLALPVFPELSPAQIDYVAGTIERFYAPAVTQQIA
ncbi:MAG: DegT/DnrJ/EryC1/StrS family aminotransferase [Gammaproteobacteria bacterium]|nr:DegT/DnrJ/EryC1/StrS family aminotransferase [Gammaproteobacteria bacterium]MDE2263182.1 DegT/DnrJ/EryC1/StrS family aminotransferase [Gammaproteobacteria bacterium]